MSRPFNVTNCLVCLARRSAKREFIYKNTKDPSKQVRLIQRKAERVTKDSNQQSNNTQQQSNCANAVNLLKYNSTHQGSGLERWLSCVIYNIISKLKLMII